MSISKTKHKPFVVKMELNSSFLSGERRAEQLKTIMTPRKFFAVFPPKLATPPFSGAGTFGGNSVVLTISAKARGRRGALTLGEMKQLLSSSQQWHGGFLHKHNLCQN